jgi:hypothetical protein
MPATEGDSAPPPAARCRAANMERQIQALTKKTEKKEKEKAA